MSLSRQVASADVGPYAGRHSVIEFPHRDFSQAVICCGEKRHQCITAQPVAVVFNDLIECFAAPAAAQLHQPAQFGCVQKSPSHIR